MKNPKFLCHTAPVSRTLFATSSRLAASLDLLVCLGFSSAVWAQNAPEKADKKSGPNRQPYIAIGHSSAFLNNPINSSGDSDNIAVVLRGKITVGNTFSVRPIALIGEYTQMLVPTATCDFKVKSNIDGYVAAGYSINTSNANNTIGNTSSPIIIAGASGYVGDYSMFLVDFMWAPKGYESEAGAVSVQTAIGIRF